MVKDDEEKKEEKVKNNNKDGDKESGFHPLSFVAQCVRERRRKK